MPANIATLHQRSWLNVIQNEKFVHSHPGAGRTKAFL
jgi:hypothetical protein